MKALIRVEFGGAEVVGLANVAQRRQRTFPARPGSGPAPSADGRHHRGEAAR
jgi:hypothetical protein